MAYMPPTQFSEIATPQQLLPYNSRIFNGRFENAPPFIAATTSSAFIDGTAGGSSSNTAYGWWAQPGGAAGIQFATDKAHSGNTSLKIAATGAATLVAGICNFNQGSGAVSGSPHNSLVIPVVGGRTYTLSGYGYFDAGTSIKLRMYSYTGNPAGWTFQSSTFTGNNASSTTTGSWQSLSTTFVAPNSATGIVVFVQFVSTGSGQNAWFDDITFS